MFYDGWSKKATNFLQSFVNVISTDLTLFLGLIILLTSVAINTQRVIINKKKKKATSAKLPKRIGLAYVIISNWITVTNQAYKTGIALPTLSLILSITVNVIIFILICITTSIANGVIKATSKRQEQQ